MLSQGASAPDTSYWLFVGDAGGQITYVKMNAKTGEFTYSIPSGYTQWSQGSTVNFDANNKYGGEVSIQSSGTVFTKTNGTFYNAAWSGTSRAIGFYSYSTNYNNYGTVTSGSSTLTNNDVVGMRIDLDNNTLDVYKNNSAFLTGITIAN